MSDLISRQAAIKYLMANMSWYYEDGYEPDEDYKRECITELINGVPSAQPTAEPVRHGKFIGTEYDGYADGNPVYYEWKCSECGCIFEEEEPTYRYCPNCGARMDEE